MNVTITNGPIESTRETESTYSTCSVEQQKVISKCTLPRFMLRVFNWLTNAFLIRLLAAIFTLQAAAMWLAFAINFVLQLLFLPFGTGWLTFLSSWFMVTGIALLLVSVIKIIIVLCRCLCLVRLIISGLSSSWLYIFSF